MHEMGILISTIDECFFQRVISGKYIPVAYSEYFITVQGKKSCYKNYLDIAFTSKFHKVTTRFQEGHGLSRSRNNCLTLAKESSLDYFVISDDDVEHFPEKLVEAVSILKSLSNVNILTCKYSNPLGPQKKYKKRKFSHNLFSILRVSSIEIILRKKVANDIKFDERFGLGQKIFEGEENIFLADAIKNGHRAMFYPLTIASHPGQTSGYTIKAGRIGVKAKIFKRIFGGIWPILLMAYIFKKPKRILEN